MHDETTGLTYEDRAIWRRIGLAACAAARDSDWFDYLYFRDYAGDLEAVRTYVKCEAYAASMHGAPDYSEAA